MALPHSEDNSIQLDESCISAKAELSVTGVQQLESFRDRRGRDSAVIGPESGSYDALEKCHQPGLCPDAARYLHCPPCDRCCPLKRWQSRAKISDRTVTTCLRRAKPAVRRRDFTEQIRVVAGIQLQ